MRATLGSETPECRRHLAAVTTFYKSINAYLVAALIQVNMVMTHCDNIWGCCIEKLQFLPDFHAFMPASGQEFCKILLFNKANTHTFRFNKPLLTYSKHKEEKKDGRQSRLNTFDLNGLLLVTTNNNRVSLTSIDVASLSFSLYNKTKGKMWHVSQISDYKQTVLMLQAKITRKSDRH